MPEWREEDFEEWVEIDLAAWSSGIGVCDPEILSLTIERLIQSLTGFHDISSLTAERMINTLSSFYGIGSLTPKREIEEI